MENFESKKEALELLMFALSINNQEEHIKNAKRVATNIAIKMINKCEEYEIDKINFWNYVIKSIREDF